MENKELKEFKEILHEVKDLDRFGKFMLFCMERLERGVWEVFTTRGYEGCPFRRGLSTS